jgi:Macrocin-O-methyltransferase (TylF)
MVNFTIDQCRRDFDVIYVQSIAAKGQHPLPLRRRPRFQAMIADLRATAGVRGEIAECGCFRGTSSHLICRALEAERGTFDGAGFHVIDSFEGLPEPGPEDRIPEDHPRTAALREWCRAGAFAAPAEKLQQHAERHRRAGRVLDARRIRRELPGPC